MRTSEKKLNKILENQIKKTLAQAISDLRNATEVEKFLADFLNESEYEVFAKRLAIAYWLKKGRSYQNIKDNLKVSSATIATAQEMSKKGGFSLLVKKVEAEEWANKWSEKIKKLAK